MIQRYDLRRNVCGEACMVKDIKGDHVLFTDHEEAIGILENKFVDQALDFDLAKTKFAGELVVQVEKNLVLEQKLAVAVKLSGDMLSCFNNDEGQTTIATEERVEAWKNEFAKINTIGWREG